MKNRVSSSVLNENPNLKTTDTDTENHGFGIISMKNIVKRYNGELRFSEIGDKFVTEVWLSNNFVPFTH